MNNASLRSRASFVIPKGRNIGVSRKIGGTGERGRAAMDFARISLLKEETTAAKPRTGLGGVSRGVVPPLTNTWKQGSSSRTRERREGESPLGSGGSLSDGLRASI